MSKTLILTALILFSGCHAPVTAPRIEPLGKRPLIDLNVSEGCLCGGSKDNAINTIINLRRDNAYYYKAITEYNKTFVDK